MFSQLCRARPKTLWDKFSVRQTIRTSGENDFQRTNNSDPNIEDHRCQLEHCTFCDYRVSRTPEELESFNLELKVTENPAYGLFVKNWFEIDEEQKENNDSFLLTNDSKSTDFISQSETSDKEILSETEHIASQDDCDSPNEVLKMNQFNIQSNVELKPPRTDVSNERLKTENQKLYDPKHNNVSWSVRKHRQTCPEKTEACDTIPNVIEFPVDEKSHFQIKSKWNKEKSFPRSLVKPVVNISDKKTDLQTSCHTTKGDFSRQRPVEKNARKKFQNQTSSEDHSKRFNKAVDPLSEISQIKTEESIQEWLARINESGSNNTGEFAHKEKPPHNSAWDLRSDEEKELKCKQHCYEEDIEIDAPNKSNQKVMEKDSDSKEQKYRSFDDFYPEILPEEIDTTSVLCNASKATPANIPMVVMQCSRLHSHMGSKPPFQQTSLPMGTLVTALYQESEYLYVQTPHGVEGYICSSNCAPIGTINDPSAMSKRPWEPCDFPIQISRHKREEFVRQQSAYIQTKLPMIGNKPTIPYINTVKIKTNFYNERYFSNTFKTKDSIKIAKTVTDILRSSPETKVSH